MHCIFQCIAYFSAMCISVHCMLSMPTPYLYLLSMPNPYWYLLSMPRSLNVQVNSLCLCVLECPRMFNQDFIFFRFLIGGCQRGLAHYIPIEFSTSFRKLKLSPLF